MTGNALIRPIPRDTEVAAPLSIAAPGSLYAVDLSGLEPKSPDRRFSRPSGGRLHWVKTIDEDRRGREDL